MVSVLDINILPTLDGCQLTCKWASAHLHKPTFLMTGSQARLLDF